MLIGLSEGSQHIKIVWGLAGEPDQSLGKSHVIQADLHLMCSLGTIQSWAELALPTLAEKNTTTVFLTTHINTLEPKDVVHKFISTYINILFIIFFVCLFVKDTIHTVFT